MNVICLILLVVFPVWTLAARQPAGISDLAKLPVEQAEHLLNNSEGSQIHFDMVSAALSSRRMDLIQMCFENQYTQVILSNAVAELQDNDFQDRIVLMMLKSESAFWPDDNPFSGRSISSSNFFGKIFVATIKRNLPDLVPNEDLIESSAARLKLAGDLAKSLDKNGKERGSSGEDGIDSTGSLQKQSASDLKRNGLNQNRADQGRSDSFTWWVTAGCIGLLFTACAVWFKVRISRSHS